MGEPVKIDTLARNLIRLSGYEPDVDIKIEYTGLRPGEKLFEELLMDEEGMQDTANKLSDLMASNVEINYGRGNYPGLDLCAKSGTAEVGKGKIPNAVFVGFTRNEDMPLAFVVVIENGGAGSTYGGAVANKVLQKCLSKLT